LFDEPISSRLWRPDELDKAARLEVGEIALSRLLCDAELYGNIAGFQSPPLADLFKKPALSLIE